MAMLAIVHLWPVGSGVDVPAREKILTADFAGSHPRDPDDQVARILGRLEVGDFVRQRVGPSLGDQGAKGSRVLIEPVEVRVPLHVSVRGAAQLASGDVHTEDSRFPQFHLHPFHGLIDD